MLILVLKTIGAIIFGIVAIEKINQIFSVNEEDIKYSDGAIWMERNANTVIRF